MAILADTDTRVCVQGITGRIGRVQAGHMLREGTRIVCGVTPGRGGQSVEGVPVFDSVVEARASVSADASVLFVPPAAALGACTDALEAGVRLIVLVTEGVLRPGVLPHQVAQVAAADTTCAHLEQGFCGPHLWHRHLFHLEIIGRV